MKGEIISLEQLYKMLHISKRKAAWMLQKRHHSVRNQGHGYAQIFYQKGGCSRLHSKERA